MSPNSCALYRDLDFLNSNERSMIYDMTLTDIPNWGLLLVAKAPDGERWNNQIQSLIGRSLLQTALKQSGRLQEEVISYTYGKNGKPYLSGYAPPFFNISHCSLAVVCVIANEEIGIDVEEINVQNYDLLRSVMNEAEVNAISHSNSPVQAFTKYWTLKESLLKCTGEGLCDDLTQLLPNPHYRFHTLEEPEAGYIISMCRCVRRG